MDDLDYELLDPNDLKKTLKKEGDNLKLSLEENEELVKHLATKLNKFDKIIFSGCGDKYAVGLLSRFLSDAFTTKNIRVIQSRILANYTPEWVDSNTLVIFLTASGTTVDVIDAIKSVKKKNVQLLIITQLVKKTKASIYSLIKGYKKSQVIIPLREGVITWPSTTSFHTFLGVLNSLIIYMLWEENIPVDALLKIQLLELPSLMEELAENKEMHEWCKLTAKKLSESDNHNFYFLGDGPRYVAARKGALVHFVESCKQDSFALENEEFVHLVIETLAEENKEKNTLILLKPRESYVSKQAMNRFHEIESLWSKKAGKDKIIIIDPFQYLTPKGIGKKNDT
jgi:glucosamine 6-phosphate synthetase-like amidotransferase/phosphosugar isomerase protein